jgi:hypothetical protein
MLVPVADLAPAYFLHHLILQDAVSGCRQYAVNEETQTLNLGMTGTQPDAWGYIKFLAVSLHDHFVNST